MRPDSLDHRVQAWLRAEVGHEVGADQIEDCSWPAGPNRVWRIRTEAGAWYLKQYQEQTKFNQERNAYRDWAPVLKPATAEWVAGEPSLLCGLISDLDPAFDRSHLADDSSTPAPPEGRQAEAGQILAQLHAIPVEDRDSLSVPEALERRLDSWLVQAEDLIPSSEAAWARERFGDPRAFGSAPRVPCHRDYTSRNWLALSSGQLAVIDFEHARLDHWRADLVKLWSESWRRNPALEAAFFDGYGRELTDEDRELMTRLSVLFALGTFVWAERHGDSGFLAQGRAQWKRLLDGSPR